MATRQRSSSGKPKSPRIQVVLPEKLCEELAELAEKESRTVSNMAKVLIQDGIKRLLHQESEQTTIQSTQRFISSLENQKTHRLKGAPKRFKFFKT